MGEIIAIALIVLIIGGAGLYLYKAKKSGAKCIGCPHAKSCPSCNKTGKSKCSCSDAKKDD